RGLENFVPEDFRHEIYLTVREGEKTFLFSGCSHRGILNIARQFRPDVLVGGFHYSKLDPDGAGAARLTAAAEELLSHSCSYYTCHCTGEAQFRFMKKTMGGRLRYLSAGSIIEL
ncbi:MAG: MBL fold metallo-hydrolase, partial [Oscillospiraceae bacterium]|nr:MBL fold metallo-hydrolase [Oscillospiraceae bacterium]